MWHASAACHLYLACLPLEAGRHGRNLAGLLKCLDTTGDDGYVCFWKIQDVSIFTMFHHFCCDIRYGHMVSGKTADLPLFGFIHVDQSLLLCCHKPRCTIIKHMETMSIRCIADYRRRKRNAKWEWLQQIKSKWSWKRPHKMEMDRVCICKMKFKCKTKSLGKMSCI